MGGGGVDGCGCGAGCKGGGGSGLKGRKGAEARVMLVHRLAVEGDDHRPQTTVPTTPAAEAEVPPSRPNLAKMTWEYFNDEGKGAAAGELVTYEG